MNKAQLIEAIAKETGLPKKDAEAALNAFIGTVQKSLKKGEPVQLIGFGTFTVVKRGRRKGRNPKTGEPMVIPARKVPKFNPGQALKDLVAGKKKASASKKTAAKATKKAASKKAASKKATKKASSKKSKK